MLITKNQDRKHVICYQRDDGSQTWMYSDDFFVRHDLSHFAVEKWLGYRSAFMGMLNNGMDIEDFADRQLRSQMEISEEAVYAENMANLFLMEIAQGPFDDFNQVVGNAFVDFGKPIKPPVLTDEQLAGIREFYRDLLCRWDGLPAGTKLSLIF